MHTTFPRDWIFPFNPNMANIHNYTRSGGGIDFCVTNETQDEQAGPDFRWHSPHLQGIKNEEELINKARYLLAIVNGAQRLSFEIGNGDILLEAPCGSGLRIPRKKDFNFYEVPFSQDMDKWKYRNGHDDPLNNDISYLLFISRYDDFSRNVLIFLGVNGVSWVVIYAIFDFIKLELRKSHVSAKEKDLIDLCGIDYSEFKRFSHTANNFAAIGPFCRHGDLGQIPPQNPMSLEDAEKLCFEALKNILRLQRQWAKDKFASLPKV